MPNIGIKLADGSTAYFSVASGAGSTGDPFIFSADRATETTLAALLTAKGAISDAVVAAGATGSDSAKLRRLTTDLDAANTKLTSLLTELGLKADLTETQPVSVSALPLPSGAATQTTLASLLTELQGKADLAETQPVSVASALPPGANAIGKLASNSGVDIGDVDVTSLPALATGTATIGAVKDAGPNVEGTRVYSSLSSLTTVQDITAAPSASKRQRLLEVDLTASAACVVTLQSETTPGNERIVFQFLAAGTQSRTWRHGPVALADKKWQATSDTSITLKISVATEEIT